MADDTPAFHRIGNSRLYALPQPDGRAWVGGILATETSQPPAKIAIKQSYGETSLGLHYLFAPAAPADAAHADAFAEAFDTYLTRQQVPSGRKLLWLPPAARLRANDRVEVGRFTFGPFSSYGLVANPYAQYYAIDSNMNAPLGANLSFSIQAGVTIAFDPEGPALQLIGDAGRAGTEIGFAMFGGDAATWLRLTGSDTQHVDAYLPFTGPYRGAFRFAGEMALAKTPDELSHLEDGVGVAYHVVASGGREGGEPSELWYPLLAGAQAGVKYKVAGVVDPLDSTNHYLSQDDVAAGSLRTVLAFADTYRLGSTFRTTEGAAITLSTEPAAAPGSDNPDPAKAGPPARAPALGFLTAKPADGPLADAKLYLAPVGDYGLEVAGAEPGRAERLRCGLSGSEWIGFRTADAAAGSDPDRLRFVVDQPAYAPVFPFTTASLADPASGGLKTRLDGTYRTVWATVVHAGSSEPVTYSAEPEGSALYGVCEGANELTKGGGVLLDSTPPRHNLSQAAGFAVPLVGYAGGVKGGGAGTLVQFESDILSARRKRLISVAARSQPHWLAARNRPLRAAALGKDAGGGTHYATTPQGLVAQVDPGTGAYTKVLLGVSKPQGGDALDFAFENPPEVLQDALRTNQLFAVAVNAEAIAPQGSKAAFDNVVNIAGWTFRAQVGRGVTPTSYRNVMVMKFCDGTLQDRVRNPNRWTDPESFSLPAGTGDDDRAAGDLASTGLSQWLQDYIDAAVARADAPGQNQALYANFKRIATDPNWRGIVVLAADLDVDTLPPQIQGLAAGIDFDRFLAHHFGVTVSRIKVDKDTGEICVHGQSSTFGLIDYEEPAFVANRQAGLGPDTPIASPMDGDFDFTVLELQCLFENAQLTVFRSYVQLSVARLFGSPVAQTVGVNGTNTARGVVLDGSYIDQGGHPVYVFQQTKPVTFGLDAEVLLSVVFRRVQFNTLGTSPDGETSQNRFLIWGTFDFAQLALDAEGGAEPVDGEAEASGTPFDVLSFGSDPGAQGPATGLQFSGYAVKMDFPVATPNATTFTVDDDGLSFDPKTSHARAGSLFDGFALSVDSFIAAPKGKTPADYGFLPVTSDLKTDPMSGAWYGLTFDVTMGTPGALVADAGFSSQMLLAWSPAEPGGKGRPKVFIGLSLPGAAPGAKLFSLQGVFKVSVGAITLLRQTAGANAYWCLRLNDIGVKIFGIAKLPPSSSINFFLFGDPDNAGSGSLGWYAAYLAEPDDYVKKLCKDEKGGKGEANDVPAPRAGGTA